MRTVVGRLVACDSAADAFGRNFKVTPYRYSGQHVIEIVSANQMRLDDMDFPLLLPVENVVWGTVYHLSGGKSGIFRTVIYLIYSISNFLQVFVLFFYKYLTFGAADIIV